MCGGMAYVTPVRRPLAPHVCLPRAVLAMSVILAVAASAVAGDAVTVMRGDPSPPPPSYVAYAQEPVLEVGTDNAVYTDGLPMFVYGRAAPEETLIIRLTGPDQTIAKFDQITVGDDGEFWHLLQVWPEASHGLPYGTYAVEVISSSQGGLSRVVDVRFSASTGLVEVPVDRRVDTLVFAPETAAVNNPVRIFVQTTSDGLLVGHNDPRGLLKTSHVHRPDGRVDGIAGSFTALHNGLYYADYTPTQEGTYVFHVVSFHQGVVSHGSAAASVLSQDLGGLTREVDRLNSVLDGTVGELETLRSEVAEFGVVLDGASANIDSSVTSMSESVGGIEEASSQLNALLLPVVSLIGVIVALQLAILARRR